MSELKIQKSLMDLAYDLAELDSDAEENKLIIQEKLSSLGDKVESYYYFERQASYLISEFREKIVFYKKCIDSLERAIEFNGQRGVAALTLMDVDSLRTPDGYKMAISTSEKVKVVDLGKIPENFKRTTIEVQADKKAIKEAIRQGITVEGAELEENVSLRLSMTQKK
jgi:hypothetical protein